MIEVLLTEIWKCFLMLMILFFGILSESWIFLLLIFFLTLLFFFFFLTSSIKSAKSSSFKKSSDMKNKFWMLNDFVMNFMIVLISISRRKGFGNDAPLKNVQAEKKNSISSKLKSFSFDDWSRSIQNFMNDFVEDLRRLSWSKKKRCHKLIKLKR